MDLVDTLRVALRALAANKLRSVLTMLGIIIGVSAVITLLSVGDGVQQYVTSQFQGIGSSLLFVFPGRLSQQGPTSQDTASHDQPLTNEDALALADSYNVPTAKAVAMEYLGYAVATYGR